MNARRTSHHTVVVRRQYDLPTEQVFRAWEDTAALEAWHTPGDASWTAEMLEHDFRVGGVKQTIHIKSAARIMNAIHTVLFLLTRIMLGLAGTAFVPRIYISASTAMPMVANRANWQIPPGTGQSVTKVEEEWGRHRGGARPELR